tara:strand:- start:432 stop:638 length:207 start_codon:yes stop_codon:yes gene_type:complete
MSKKKAVEIVKNISQTLEKLYTVKSRANLQYAKEMFNLPRISEHVLEKKKKDIINKYNLKEKEYGITN